MKKIILLLFLAFSTFTCYGQINSGVKDGVPYISPTIKNFITLTNCSYREFSEIMDKYNYSAKDSYSEYVTYSASLDNYLVHAVSVAFFDYFYKGGSIVVWITKDEMYPASTMSDIYSQLRSHYIRSEGQTELYAFNYRGKAYGIMLKKESKAYILRMIDYGKADSRLSELR
jgi:hypothetical protein